MSFSRLNPGEYPRPCGCGGDDPGDCIGSSDLADFRQGVEPSPLIYEVLDGRTPTIGDTAGNPPNAAWSYPPPKWQLRNAVEAGIYRQVIVWFGFNNEFQTIQRPGSTWVSTVTVDGVEIATVTFSANQGTAAYTIQVTSGGVFVGDRFDNRINPLRECEIIATTENNATTIEAYADAIGGTTEPNELIGELTLPQPVELKTLRVITEQTRNEHAGTNSGRLQINRTRLTTICPPQ